MHPRLPFRVAFAALLFALAPLRGAIAASPAIEWDRIIAEEVRKGFAGTVLIARGGSIRLDRGYGDGILGDARYWIASTAKQFVAAAILWQVDHGHMALEDPLSRFFPDAPADKRDITVLELLSHTSGLASADSAEGARDRESAVRAIFAQPVAGPRGRFRYSNDNYELAAAIVEVVTGLSYHEAARDLWRLAELTDTGFAGDRGTMLLARSRGKTPERLAHRSWGAQGVFSSTRDLWVWSMALRDGKIISPASVERMFRGVVPIQEGEAALGWFVGRGDDGKAFYFTRGNEDWGPNSLVYLYPETKTTVVILTHAGDAPDGTSWSRAMLARLVPTLR